MDKEQILYEDKDIIVCHKPAGIATQTAKVGQRDMVSEVANYLAAASKADSKSNKRPYVGLIHRLDQPVEGILVFAKNQRAAGELSKQISDGRMEKYYYAVVALDRGAAEPDIEVERMPDAERVIGKTKKTLDEEVTSTKTWKTLINYLYKDNKLNTSTVVNRNQNGAKRAELHYSLLSCMPVKDFFKKYDNITDNNIAYTKTESVTPILSDYENTDIALAQIKLITGRHHQIRVQMSNAGMSLLGDYKYADDKTMQLAKQLDQKQVALCAYKLEFNHPITGKRMSFHRGPESGIFQIFSL
ncbi:MAG: RluA family pseudouridine synthase [Lachnospiraceae bacterium]|nr:RluA family pseudouridine synthase [Lachnospiraceae bacterium]